MLGSGKVFRQNDSNYESLVAVNFLLWNARSLHLTDLSSQVMKERGSFAASILATKVIQQLDGTVIAV